MSATPWRRRAHLSPRLGWAARVACLLVWAAGCEDEPSLGRCDDPSPVLVDGRPTGVERCAQGSLHRAAPLECPIAPSTYNECLTDADCASTHHCACSEEGSQCKPTSCRSDADCGAGLMCLGHMLTPDECLLPAFECQSPQDECVGDADCGGTRCNFNPERARFECNGRACSISF
jgi:hypothetical protein